MFFIKYLQSFDQTTAKFPWQWSRSWYYRNTYATVCDVAPANAPHTSPPNGVSTISPVSLFTLVNVPFIARMASLKVSYAKNPKPEENNKGNVISGRFNRSHSEQGGAHFPPPLWPCMAWFLNLLLSGRGEWGGGAAPWPYFRNQHSLFTGIIFQI